MRGSRLAVSLSVAVFVLPLFALTACGTPGAGRYQIASASTQSAIVVYRLDTRTGEVHMIHGDEAVPIKVLSTRAEE